MNMKHNSRPGFATVAIMLLLGISGCGDVEKATTGHCNQLTYEFISGEHKKPGSYDRLMDDYDECDHIDTAAGIFLEGPPFEGEEDDWLEVVCYFADRKVEKAAKRINNMRVEHAPEGGANSGLATAFARTGKSTLRESWNELRTTSHSWRSEGGRVVVFKE